MADPRRTVLIVLGPGRSGTSAVTGSLAHAGYRIPDALASDRTNPRGFHEPRWLVGFDKRQLGAAGVGTNDSDPTALDVLEGGMDRAAAKAEIAAWIAPELEQGTPLVLKDPRVVWFFPLWRELADELDFDLQCLFMLRHPSEVSASRGAYYGASDARAVAGWINVALMTERLTRGSRRAVVHFPDLLADWRHELRRAGERIDLHLSPGIDERPHPIDGFLDPSLRRMASGWGERPVPPWLAGIADRTFDALQGLVEGAADVDGAVFDALSAEYASAFEFAFEVTKPRRRRRAITRRAAKNRALAEAAAARRAAPPEPEPTSWATAVRSRLLRRR